MHPHWWQALHDGMLRLSRCHLKWQTSAVLPSIARSWVGNYLAIFVIPHRAGGFCALSPTTDAGHQVEFAPVGEGIVGGVNDDQASTVLYIFIELGLKVRRPVGSVEVPDDRFVFAELGLVVAEIAVIQRSSGHCYLKQATVFQFFFKNWRDHLP